MTDQRYTEISWLSGGALQVIRFDACVRQIPEAAATPTEHPVEDGADVADHVHAALDALVIDVVVSNKPIADMGTQMDGAQGVSKTVEVPDPIQIPGPVSIPRMTSITAFGFDREFDRVGAVDALLLELTKAGQRLDVHTTLRTYQSMVITRYSPTIDAQTGGSLQATISFREIETVSSEIVSVPDPAETREEPGNDRGRRDTEDADGDGRSALHRLFF